MIKQFQNLSREEQALLFEAPALVSVLASSSLNTINEVQKADAIKLSHLKPFTASAVLLPYYHEVERHFTENFEAAVKKYFPFDHEKTMALQKELAKVNVVLGKLDKPYAQLLYTSFQKYAKHVKKAGHSVFQDFLFPIPIPGLSA